jgi:hypothetical protein
MVLLETFALKYLPDWLILVLSMVASVAIALVIHASIRRLKTTTRPAAPNHATTRPHHEIVDNLFGVVSVLYAIVLGFVVVTSWQQFDRAEDISMQEERALVELADYTQAYGDLPNGKSLQTLIVQYANMMSIEWDLMRDAVTPCSFVGPDPKCPGDSAFSINNATAQSIEDQAFRYTISDKRIAGNQEATVALVDRFLDSRSQRHHYYLSHLKPILWYALIIGAVITLAVTYVGEVDWRTQHWRTVGVSAMIGLMFALALIFDHPFTGQTGVPDTWPNIAVELETAASRNGGGSTASASNQQ